MKMRKKICIINTGGTILAKSSNTGYEAGASSFGDVFGDLLSEFKPLKNLEFQNSLEFQNKTQSQNTLEFQNKVEFQNTLEFQDFSLKIITPFSIGSQDMDNAHLLRLGKAVIKASKKYDFIIITHGSDTLEEGAFFLSLLKRRQIGVLLIASMYPPSDENYDGADNLKFALKTALTSDLKCVKIAMNNELLEPKKTIKFKSWGKDAFKESLAKQKNTLEFQKFSLPKALPKVAVIYADGQFFPELYNLKSLKGVVTAGMGAGTMSKKALKFFSKAGIPVVRSSRVSMPQITSKEVDDKKYGFIKANSLSPAKAKILLMLALSKKSKNIAKYFENF